MKPNTSRSSRHLAEGYTLPNGGEQEGPLAVPAFPLVFRSLGDGGLLLLLRHDGRLHGELARILARRPRPGRSNVQDACHRWIIVADERLVRRTVHHILRAVLRPHQPAA